jgi:hypothetical protein
MAFADTKGQFTKNMTPAYGMVFADTKANTKASITAYQIEQKSGVRFSHLGGANYTETNNRD